MTRALKRKIHPDIEGKNQKNSQAIAAAAASTMIELFPITSKSISLRQILGAHYIIHVPSISIYLSDIFWQHFNSALIFIFLSLHLQKSLPKLRCCCVLDSNCLEMRGNVYPYNNVCASCSNCYFLMWWPYIRYVICCQKLDPVNSTCKVAFGLRSL